MKQRDPNEPLQGKTASQENFPVASRLLARDKRATVMAYYAFARAADDVADAPDIPAERKLADLAAFEKGLLEGTGPIQPALALRGELMNRALPLDLAGQLLTAFRQDAEGVEIATWSDLRAYCRYSANPVGRFLLALHGEDAALEAQSDALCSGLQILNHLQDCKSDWQALTRCYLPGNWMAECGCDIGDLEAEASSPGLRQVLDRCLDETGRLLSKSAPLARCIKDRRLAFQAGTTQALAVKLLLRLRKRDPLARSVRLSRFDFLVAALSGFIAAMGSRREAA
ncbi:squalene/phytoene synthase family protein [Limibacillus sp. MBR-115]|jgi:squalene synthase HpnC|uniref:squalene/phytoene synthase family protein n=1 Tax=Limibacillus sp. MBR-115 TaxID=3156465 RepID=UPI0033936759